ncbi:GntR family transcriptional regulator [Hoeflea sp. WL0058]|uniref:GntR family transcriptional regulator n=1 Tax=Flavimaribacter sediminis TaxID=2865987 RepID=A0AAE3D1M0_9HYPH|nr:GntR family transcriptional regulator [Flavimaribacter sediminis]MBW8638031.1 GntR family transcriptional regulator [Flavimaribacter sediminis]
MGSRSELISTGLETVERTTLQDQIYRQLRQRIMSGFYLPGQSLSLRSVAEAVGASVMPVRDALRRLETENALVAGHNRALEIPRLDRASLREIGQMRIALEGLAVERAAASIGSDDIETLHRLCSEMDTGIADGDTEAYLTANWAFHSHIYRAAPAEMLLPFIESLWLRMGPWFRVVALDRSHLDRAMIFHGAIVDALARGDVAAAREGVVGDIEAAVCDLEKWLGENGH